MGKTHRFWLLSLSLLLTAGCSGSMALPWDDALLDPGRIATREPLEIPPDLNTLPTEKRAYEGSELTWTNPNNAPADDDAGTSLLLPLPSVQEEAPLDRNEKERLPRWMGEPVQSE